MNQYKAFRRMLWQLSGVAGTNTITAATNTYFKVYQDGMLFSFIPAITNTSAATLNVNGLGAKTIKKNGPTTDVAAGDLTAGVEYVVIYNLSSDIFQLLGGAAGGGSGTVTSVGLAVTNDDTVSVSGSPVTTSGTLTAAAVDAGSDKIVFWDDSAGKKVYLTVGTGLSITGTTLNALGSGEVYISDLGNISGTNTIDLSTISNGGIVRATVTGTTTLQLSNGTDGKKFILELSQDATGTRLITLSGTYFRFGTDITTYVASETASKMDRIGCIYNTTAGKADVVATVKGF